jgi:hypothetical protein
MMREVRIGLRYRCSQCGEYFNVESVTTYNEDILDAPPITIFKMYSRYTSHDCYGKVPDGRQRFYGLGVLVGWTWSYIDEHTNKV